MRPVQVVPDDEYEYHVMIVQFEQWKRNYLPDERFRNLLTWATQHKVKQAPWMIVRYLRANAAGFMLRWPLFLSGSPPLRSERKKYLGIELIIETINILSILDRTTDTYAKLHPYFRHIFSTTYALLFLIIAHAKENQASSAARFSLKSSWTLDLNFSTALALATAYYHYSQASKKLWKRLILLKQPLCYFDGILRGEDDPGILDHNSMEYLY